MPRSAFLLTFLEKDVFLQIFLGRIERLFLEGY